MLNEVISTLKMRQMTDNQEVKRLKWTKKSIIENLKIGSMLIFEPNKEPFRITGLNTLKRDQGSLLKVTGRFNDGMCSEVNLDLCSLSQDQSLMY